MSLSQKECYLHLWHFSTHTLPTSRKLWTMPLFISFWQKIFSIQPFFFFKSKKYVYLLRAKLCSKCTKHVIVIEHLDFSFNKSKLPVMRNTDHSNFGNVKSEISARKMRRSIHQTVGNLVNRKVKLGILGWWSGLVCHVLIYKICFQ